jgi:glycosyltransferase involved in cell wall biosynthesis
MRGFKRFSLHRADAVTVNSSATSNQVMSIAPTIPEPRLIPMGISTNEPDPRRSVALRSNYRQGNGPLLVFVGRLVEGKGVDDLLYALVKLKLSLPDVSALIVGDGPERSRLEQATIRLNIHEKVFFAGWIETADVSSYLAAADIFIGPSRLAADGAIEAQGLTFLEAMFAGLPVIATDLGGIKDIVIHEKTGLLVADRSPNEIAQGVIRLTQNTRLRDTLVTQARALSKQFTRESCASKFSRLFEQHTAKGIE